MVLYTGSGLVDQLQVPGHAQYLATVHMHHVGLKRATDKTSSLEQQLIFIIHFSFLTTPRSRVKIYTVHLEYPYSDVNT